MWSKVRESLSTLLSSAPPDDDGSAPELSEAAARFTAAQQATAQEQLESTLDHMRCCR